MSIRILVTGGTFDKRYDELRGRLSFKETHVPEMLELGRCRLDVEIETLMMIDSLEMTAEDRARIVERCRTCEESRILITHGTDTMSETAQALSAEGLDKTIVLTPQATESKDMFGKIHRIGRIGVSRNVSQSDITLYRPNPVEAVGMTSEEIRFIVERTGAFLGDFFVGRGDVKELGGPVKVAQVSSEVASLGVVALINLMALLSLNIGLFNLFPIPMLDGGHLMYFLVEAIRGRPLSPRVQEIGFRFGLALVFTLTIFTLYNDLF